MWCITLTVLRLVCVDTEMFLQLIDTEKSAMAVMTLEPPGWIFRTRLEIGSAVVNLISVLLNPWARNVMLARPQRILIQATIF